MGSKLSCLFCLLLFFFLLSPVLSLHLYSMCVFSLFLCYAVWSCRLRKESVNVLKTCIKCRWFEKGWGRWKCVFLAFGERGRKIKHPSVIQLHFCCSAKWAMGLWSATAEWGVHLLRDWQIDNNYIYVTRALLCQWRSTVGTTTQPVRVCGCVFVSLV